jgi:RimJ/RimL family protein N-acetyltransferase
MLKDYGWIDLGFRLAQPCWGKGLATEMASAWVRAAFGRTSPRAVGGLSAHSFERTQD